MSTSPAAPVPPASAGPADYLASVRELAPMLASVSGEIDERRELPERVVEALVARGLFRLLLPRPLGGAELLPAEYVPIIEELAKTDASTAWCINQNSGCSMTAAHLAPAAAREIFGGPRGILAWGPGPGEARVAPGGYRVTASWSFASGS
ncbi:MAG TPA: acyl-CoA dehydrogenase family protein, partial [Stellaceae bacterium]|nr:acyl-CoA dehydrogenase family protein [Stellaceae bacterium]